MLRVFIFNFKHVTSIRAQAGGELVVAMRQKEIELLYWRSEIIYAAMPCSELQTEMMSSYLHVDSYGAHPSKETVLKQVTFILYDQQPLVENSLDLLDDETKRITRIKSASTSRVFWKVPSQSFRGSNQKDYICTEKFCPCKSYRDLAKLGRHDVLCKHLIAIRIGTALQLVIEQIVTDKVFADMMCD